MDSPSSTFSFRRLPWAGIAALAIVFSLERTVFGSVDVWRRAEAVLEQLPSALTRVELGVARDRIALHEMQRSDPDDRRVIVFGNSRAKFGVIFPEEVDGYEIAQVTHAPLSPFFARTFAAEAASVRPDVFVYPLCQFETHKPVVVLAQSSYGGASGFLDVLTTLGPLGIWERRVEIERLALATVFDTYRYRDVLDRCWLNDLTDLRPSSTVTLAATADQKEASPNTDSPAQDAGPAQKRRMRDSREQFHGRPGARNRLREPDTNAGAVSVGERGPSANEREDAPAKSRALSEDEQRYSALFRSTPPPESRRPPIHNLDAILAKIDQDFRKPVSNVFLNTVHAVRSGPHVRDQERLIEQTIEVLRAADCEVLLVEAPLNPVCAPLYDETTRAEFVEFADWLVAEHGVHFLSAEETGPFLPKDFVDLLHINNRRGQRLGKAVLAKLDEIFAAK